MLGPGIIEGLQTVGLSKQRGLLLLAQLSNQGNLITAAYTQQAIALAQRYPAFVMGFIAQQRLIDDPHWLHVMPGVQCHKTNDSGDQRYITPEQAIQQGADIIIVGRGIYQATDPAQTAARYQQIAWAATQP